MINVCNNGSLVLVEPDEGDHLAFADWLIDNVGDDALFWGDALVVEPRFVQDLIDGLESDGFEVMA
jgi:hypothetical protein